MKFTAEQWNASRETERHVLVEAGAGTGKTRTAIGRILYLLGAELTGERIAHPLALRDIAAITFTNHAAADLKSKLREALRTAGLPSEAYLVDTARIGTIHRFCSDVLREFALRAGGNPQQDVLDEVERGALVAAVVRDTLLWAIEEDGVAGLADMLAIWTIRDLTRFITSLLDDLDRLRTYLRHRDQLPAHERVALDLAEHATAALDERLAARGLLDFDRIIVRTRDLLRANASVRDALRRRVRVLIVDEFQDVDPAQKEIAYLLGDPASSRRDTTRLLLVGDPKQSIYRFRRADITVWSEVERDFREGGHGRVITLHQNFRSTANILGFVDATVGRLLEQPIDGEWHRDFEVRYEPLLAEGTHAASPDPVELLVVPVRGDGRDYRANDLRQIEAAAVAQRARALVDDGVADWGDMAVIMPTWALMHAYQRAFESIGGTAYPLRSAAFYEQREIVDMILALEAVRDPVDDRALFGFLRSPFVGLDDRALLEIAQQAVPPYWLAADELAIHEQETLAAGLGLLRRLGAMRDRVPIDELLETLLDDTGYLAHLRLQGEEQNQAIANVEKFLRQARAASRWSVSELLRMIAEARFRDADEGEVPLVPRADAVTMTTVHSAKGLQWDVVFWADLVRRARGGEHRDLLIGRRRFALRRPDVDSDAQPESWQVVKRELDHEVYAERKRVWYVAATRAAKRLIVTGLPAGAMGKSRATTVADHVWGALGTVPLVDGGLFTYVSLDGTARKGIVRIADSSVPTADDVVPRPDPASLSIDVLAVPPEPLTVRADRPRHSASELLQYARCPRKHWFAFVLGVREPAADRSSQAFIDAAARGQIVHDVLQWLQDEDELDALLEDAIGRWDPAAPAPDALGGSRYRWHLRREITNVSRHPAYRAMVELPTARRELAFLHIADRDACYQGEIDLAAAEGDALVLLDVKTSRGDTDALRKKAAEYRPQRDVYVHAAERIAAMRVTRFGWQFSAANLHVADALSSDAGAESERRLAAMISEMGEAPPRLTDHPAECQFCGYHRVGWCAGVEEEATQRDPAGPQLSLPLS